MRSPRFIVLSATSLLLAFLIFCPLMSGQELPIATASDQLKPGVVVDHLTSKLEAEKAGLQEGDVLLRWSRGDSKGEIESPFDLSFIEIEHGPRGAVTVEGLRGTDKRNWTLGPDIWGVQARPNFQGPFLDIYREGQQLSVAGKPAEAMGRWRAIADQIDGPASVWLLAHAGNAFADGSKLKEAAHAYQEAVEKAMKADPRIMTLLLRAWAQIFNQWGDWANAEKYYQQSIAESQKLGRESLIIAINLDSLGEVASKVGNLAKAEQYYYQALAINQKLAPASLAVASSFNNIGNAAFNGGNLTKAEEYYRRALEISQKLVPESFNVAGGFYNLGLVAYERGTLGTAEEYFGRALEIQMKLDPKSLAVVSSFNNLGSIAQTRGNLAKAEEYLSQALVISQKLAPESLYVATSFFNLGNVAYERGTLGKAEEYFGQALEIQKKLAPGSLDVAAVFNSLGNVARKRGDLVKAEEYYSQTLKIIQKLAPESRGVAAVFLNLGTVVSDRGDLGKAEEYYGQALVIQQALAPGGLDVATTFNNLANVAVSRGDLGKAEEYHVKALEIRQKLAPESLDVAESFFNLGSIADKREDLPKAEEYYRQAQAITGKLAPKSSNHADTVAALAGIARRTRKLEAAAQLYEQALKALEEQTATLGGTEQVRAGFRATHAAYYKDYVDLLILQKQPELAFHVAERSRARSMLEMLAEAHVDIHKGVQPGLLELERRLQGEISATINRRINLLTEKHTEDQVAAVTKEIEDLISQYQEAEGRIRISSPGYAALTQPQPLSATQVQEQLLDPDTLLLEYCLGEERSYVWAISSSSVTAYEIPKRTEVEEVARRLYQLLSVGQKTRVEAENQRNARFRETATRLSRMVLGPVVSELEGKRLIIVSDGALQYIPFAALPRADGGLTKDAKGTKNWTPLAVEHEIVTLPSASVLPVLRAEQAERKQGTKTVAVFADPVLYKNDERVRLARMQRRGRRAPPTVEAKGASVSLGWPTGLLTRSISDVRSGTGKEFYLPRLSFTRQEARAIVAVTPAGQAMTALDFDASRTAVLSPDLAQYRIVHIATHGLLDSINPGLSGLVLSLVDDLGRSQDGFLGLQDIYNLNLSADLVVLSACETGLGKDIKSEGLIGLTRGFMYAGASRVVSSLWKADDAATAELMGRFYKAMEQEKMRPAAALRQAQMQMWNQKRWRNPYFWAGFQMQGEWK